jgi:hypothetical protein
MNKGLLAYFFNLSFIVKKFCRKTKELRTTGLAYLFTNFDIQQILYGS